jgi:hypothetical protein
MRRVGMKRHVLLALVVAVLVAGVLGGARTASAGGSNWELDREHYSPGDELFAWAPISWEHNANLGTPDDGPYDAWLAPLPPPGSTEEQRVPAGAVPVGEIEVSLAPYGDGPIKFGPHHAELRFVVPDLPPGQYQILHANTAGKTLGDLTFGFFWIDASEAGAAGATRGTPNFAG